MTTRIRRTQDPLSPHLLLALALGQSQSPIPVSEGPISLLPWRLRREALDRMIGGERHSRGHQPPYPSAGAAPPLFTVADVMTREVVSVSTVTPVSEIADLLAGKRISAVPVVGADGSLLGVVSKSDLIRRAEIGTERRRSWWRGIFADIEAEAADYVRTHGRKARHVMTRGVITATENMSLADVVDVMERQRLKWLPVIRGNRPVGIVSRSDLVQALARHRTTLRVFPPDDDTIRRNLMARVKALTPSSQLIDISVRRGAVAISGLVDSVAEREAILIAAENTPGIRSVQDRMNQQSRSMSRAGRVAR